jgi:methylase of polypeptide subunit release factors
MSLKWHENVRINVTNLLLELLKEAVIERIRVERDPQIFSSLTLLRQLLDTPGQIVVLMPQEVYTVKGEKKAIDMALGSSVVFDFKSRESEFDEAKLDAETKYRPFVSRAKFFIVTNWFKWRIYKVRKTELELVKEFNDQEAKEALKTQVINQLRELKVPALPQNIEALFKLRHEELLQGLRDAFNVVRNNDKIKPLYEAYKSMMKMLYGEGSESFFEDLFVRHTYMQMTVLASLSFVLDRSGSPEDMCSGALIGIDVALPYLNWWKAVLRIEEARGYVERVLKEVAWRTGLIDWSLNTAEDVFRTLYEFLVETPIRRKLGEYYTPFWLVDMILSRFNIKGKVVLDPFCGSGTFLLRAFYKKLEQGEKPEEALDELIGFDVNPLAVAVARAELIIAYLRVTGGKDVLPPHIYHIDTFAMWFGEETILVTRFKELVQKAKDYLQTLINFREIELSTHEALTLLRRLEVALSRAVKFAFFECKLDTNCLERKILQYLKEGLSDLGDNFTVSFLHHFEKDSIGSTIAKLVEEHGGNEVWSFVLMSIYAPILMSSLKPDIIVTNPPWIPVTEYAAPYSDKIREYLLKKISPRVSDKAAQLLAGADVAAAALGKSLELASEGVAFIMNRDQLFNHRSAIPAGILATYCVLVSSLRDSRARVALFSFDFDVFQHGVYPAVVIVKKNGKTTGLSTETYVVKLELPGDRNYSKSLGLEHIRDYLRITPFSKNYEDYVKPGILYFAENLDVLAQELNLDRICPKGLYIMGIYGGEKKKGEEEYAGLILEERRWEGSAFKFKLHNTQDALEVPGRLLDEYGVKPYKMIYEGEINPFKLNRQLDILLSQNGEEKLKSFLLEALEFNERRISSETYNKISKLIKELKQPDRIVTLNVNKYYVLYRCDRAFTALAFKPTSESFIVESHVSYVECSSEDVAYYYSAVLNYLAFKVIEMGRSFARHQFARPLLALYTAGLSWRSMDTNLRARITELSQILHNKTPQSVYSNQRVALRQIVSYLEFRELVQLLDSKIGEETLRETLNLVSNIGADRERTA